MEFRLEFNKHLIDSTFSLMIHFLEEAIRTRSWEFCDFYLEIVETISVVMEILMEERLYVFLTYIICILYFCEFIFTNIKIGKMYKYFKYS